MRCKNVTWKTKDGSLNIYYNGEFRGAIESTSMSVSIVNELVNRIEKLEKELKECKDEIAIMYDECNFMEN